MKKPFISLTSDFGIQSQGVGIMEGTVLDICPEANVIHLMHGLPDYDITCAARTMETVRYLPVGYHICVVDPGVGTNQKRIIIKTKRGDYLIGPDNGVLMSAAKILGCEKVVEIANPKYMKQPVSPIFHGRDIFSPTAAHLANGVVIEEFGEELKFSELVKAPYEEAAVEGEVVKAEVIHINKYGSVHLNILHKQWDEFNAGEKVLLKFDNLVLEVPVVETFGQVKEGQPLILKDDYGRVEVAVNLGNFSEKYGIKVKNRCVVEKI